MRILNDDVTMIVEPRNFSTLFWAIRCEQTHAHMLGHGSTSKMDRHGSHVVANMGYQMLRPYQ
jgi:hypothetical protein